MAIGKQGTFQIYQDEFYGGFVETIQQNVDAFNAASNGAIRMISANHKGNYQKEAFFDVVGSLISRRDIASVAAATDLDFTSDEFVGVKLARNIGPVAKTNDAWRVIGKNPSEFSFLLGQQFAPAIQQEWLNSALAALEGKLDSVAALEHDRTAGTMRTEDIVDGIYKFGDAQGRIVALVMHSKVVADLLKDQIADSAAVYHEAGQIILAGTPATFGRPIIMTDSASLVESDGVSTGVDAYSTLGLVAGAAVINESEDRQIVSDLVTGLKNLVTRIQGEYSYTLTLKGCEYDVGNGGVNPDATAVALATNWDTQVADNKLLPGIIIKSR